MNLYLVKLLSGKFQILVVNNLITAQPVQKKTSKISDTFDYTGSEFSL